ncbi:MAG TPA: hypothetical protein VNZ62_15130 [Capillimicrobium sp.]|nr:hypothetical protein [Capillimicrobium sp.]
MSTDDPQPDHTDPGRDRDVGSGYPEEQPPGAQPGTPNREGSGEGGRDAPDTDGGRDSDPQTSTGNPGAAG